MTPILDARAVAPSHRSGASDVGVRRDADGNSARDAARDGEVRR